MAIYHLHVGIIQRSKGKHAVAASAYRRAAKLMDQRVGKAWNYSNKPHVIHSEIMAPTNAPAWARELVTLQETDPSKAAEQLWNFVESSEKRIDSQLAREVEFALPIELNEEQNIALARSFIQDQLVLRGMMADWAVHWDEGNPHVHVLLTMRRLTENGFGARALEWNDKRLLLTWREQWAAYVNFHLRLHQHTVHVDHRSYAVQGIDLIPGIHEGKAAQSMAARGVDLERMEEADQIRRLNLVQIADNPIVLLDKLSTQQDTFTSEHIGQELGRYINDRGQFAAVSQKTPSRVLTRRSIAKILVDISHHESVFSEKEIAKAVAPFTDHADAFARAVIQVKASRDLVSLGIDAKGDERFTTKKLWRVENSLQTIADKLRHAFHITFSESHLHRLINAYQQQTGKSLTTEQLLAVNHLVAPLSLRCVVGRAGTGKSFLLGAAKHIWESKGLKVYGVALSGIAADGLNREAGIQSTTIESFKKQVSRGLLVLKPFDVVVMDEAGMSDSVSMLAVLKIVKSARAKLVLIGDPAQLQPVGPGASFRALLERTGFVDIQTVYRQSEPWQRDATMAFSAGHIGKGLAAYATHQAVHIKKTADVAIETLVTQWLQQHRVSKDLSQLLVMAHRNQDVTALNQHIRQARIAGGDLKAGFRVKTARGDIAIAKGDRLLFLKNDRTLGLSNGRFATVTHIDVNLFGRVKQLSVTLDGDQHPLTIDLAVYNNFALGYAATVHKAQGITIDHTLIYAGGYGWNRHLTYVAFSRHRQTCHLYADKTTYRDFKALQRQLGRLGLKDSVLDFPLAFSERRGLIGERYLQRLQKQLLQSLTHLKSKLVESLAFRKHLQTATHVQAVNLKNSHPLRADEISQRSQTSAELTFKKERHLSPTATIPIDKPPTTKTPHYDIQKIRADLNAQVESVTRHYLGEPKSRQGHTWRFGRHQGSLVVTIDGDKKGLWHDFQTQAGGDMLGLIKTITNPSDFKALLQEAMRFLGGNHTYIQSRVSAQSHSSGQFDQSTHIIPVKNKKSVHIQTILAPAATIPDSPCNQKIISTDLATQQKIQKVQMIVQNSQPIQGTLAEQYLRQHRGIEIPVLDKTFRFHPQLKHWMTGKDYPALLVIARDEKDAACGLQAIFLDPHTGQKANIMNQSAKLSRGFIKGGAMVQEGTAPNKFAIAEGPETALSIAQAHPDWTVYASFGMSNLAHVASSLPSKELIMVADNDGEHSHTQKNMEQAAQTLSKQGKSVWVATPQKPANQAKWDFNDVLRQGGIEAVKKDLEQAILYSGPIAQIPAQTITQINLPEKITSPITTQTTSPKISEDQSTTEITLKSILRRYVEMELEQTRLIALKHTAYVQDPKNAPEAAKKTVIQSQNIHAFIKKACQHPDIQTAIETSKKIKSISIADRGGFINIYERLNKGEWFKEDIDVLVQQLRNKAMSQSLSYKRTQDQSREGRKQ